MNIVGSFIRRARERKGVSQTVLAEALGVKTPQSVSNIERGVSPFPVRHLKATAKVLGVRQVKIVAVLMKAEGAKILKQSGVRLR